MTRPNVLLITIDSLRADRVGHLSDGRGNTPALDRLAESGSSLTKAVANGTYTKISFPNILASEYLSHHGSYRRIVEQQTTLPQILSSAGYTTIGVHTNPLLSRQIAYHWGFDHFYDGLELSPISKIKLQIDSYFTSDSETRERIQDSLTKLRKFMPSSSDDKEDSLEKCVPYARANEVNQQALQFVRGAASPMFLWVHYMDPHLPYLPPAEVCQKHVGEALTEERMWELDEKLWSAPAKLSEEEFKTVSQLYNAEIQYTDRNIGELVSTFRSQTSGDTVVAAVADHGDQFQERGEFGHGGDYSSLNVYDEILRVPMIFDFEIQDAQEKPAGLIDTSPTLLSHLNMAIPETYEGIDLSENIAHERPIISEGFPFKDRSMQIEEGGLFALRSGKWKYIFEANTDEVKLFDLDEDPGETQNLIGSYPEIEDRLSTELQLHLDAAQHKVSSLNVRSVDDQLDALGYR